jgi:uncharacterized protein YbaA (DUF1428 family)
MSYVEGFVVPVPVANKDAFVKHAAANAPLFKDVGIARVVECWADDVPDGEITDFKRAVQAGPDETVVFAWFEYPDRAARDATNERMRTDPRMQRGEIPFDARRMILGGFETLAEDRANAPTGYVDGVLVPVREDRRQEYTDFAVKAGEIFRDHGASRVIDAWGDDVPEGQITDYRRAVQAEQGEAVIFSWIEWPSKEARDKGWQTVMDDPRMQGDMPFDGKRMVYGGFAPLIDA